jgi:meso-butanediol dehydrogenase/(S,S)-butanediol dehydrogenase/diacetyl reductase
MSETDRMRFADREVLVTGGGSGIGAVMAQRFAAEGASVVIADIRGEVATQTAAEIPGARAVTLDVADAVGVREVIESLDKVDVLVNNAAFTVDTPLAEMTAEGWQREIDVTLTGPFLLSQAVLPLMERAGHGAIVNVSSVNAMTYLGNEAYSAAKAGLLSLTRSIAVKYGPQQIRCNAVVPGTISTPIWQRRLAVDPEVFDRINKWYPLGRVGTPEDVAAAVLFLASDEAAWITGVSLPVDGGLLAGNQQFTNEIVIARP